MAAAGLAGARMPSLASTWVGPLLAFGGSISIGIVVVVVVVVVVVGVARPALAGIARTSLLPRRRPPERRDRREDSGPHGATTRTPTVVIGCVVLFVGCSLLSERSQNGLHIPPSLRQRSIYDITLVSDPATVKATTTADARVHGKHLQLRASGAPGQVLASLAAGQRLRIRGRLRAIEAPISPWLRSRHIAGRLTVTRIEKVAASGDTPHLYRLANIVRSRLLRSGQVLPESQQGLFAGFLLGDDRRQSPETIDDFRAAGLSHLLVVSGQNVAFTLAVFEPVLRRLRRRPRLAGTLALLVMFATVTRFEPSVLRAVWMAGVVAVARCVGRPQRGMRVLSLAVIVLTVVDPLLSYSVGFALSLAATAGLALWSDPLSRRLPLPGWARSMLAPTLAAQAGASIVLIPTFGSVPVVSLVSNVVVVPVASPLMGWGVAAGLPAGILGRGASRIVHIPTSIVLAFVAWAARTAARVPLGVVGLVPVLLFGLLTWWACRSASSHRARVWGTGLGMLMAWPTCAVIVASPTSRSDWPIERGARLWTSRDVARGWPSVAREVPLLVITNDVDVGRLLAALRLSRITAVRALVVANGGRSQSATVHALGSRVSIGAVVVADIAMSGGSKDTVRVVRPVLSIIGDLIVEIRPLGKGKLDVHVGRLPVT